MSEAQGWTTVPLLAAFTGIKILPWWLAVASNNANPQLSIGAAGVRYRTIRLREVPWSRIEQVDVRTAIKTVNLVFHFQDSAFTFSGNVGNLDAATKALALLASHVALGERAQKLMAARHA